jgi:hypothetical protein
VSEHSAPTSISRGLAAVAGTSRLLASSSFEDVLAMTPALALRAVPTTARAEFWVARNGAARTITSVADRGRDGAAGAGHRYPHVACLPIAVLDRADAGELRLFTSAAEGFDGGAVMVAEVLASTIEAALDRAVLRDDPGHLQEKLAADQDIGVATGLVMASRGVDRQAAYQVLCGISRDQQRRVADVAAELIRAGESGAQRPRLRLVGAPLPGDGEPTP